MELMDCTVNYNKLYKVSFKLLDGTYIRAITYKERIKIIESREFNIDKKEQIQDVTTRLTLYTDYFQISNEEVQDLKIEVL